MPVDRDARDHDIVIFGATGFTGELTAAYLAEHAPVGLRWALAGRNQEKLEAVRSRLARSTRPSPYLPLLKADSSDDGVARARSPSRPASSITTVGPYLLHGEPLVAACAEAGTDYVDLTGEPEFVDRMYLEHHDTAVETGARIVHACRLRLDPARPRCLVHRPGARLAPTRSRCAASCAPAAWRPGGTFHSAMTAMSRPAQMRAAMVARRKKEGRPEGRKSRAVVRQAAPRPAARPVAAAAADDRPVRGGAVGCRAGVVRSRLPLQPLRRAEDAALHRRRIGGSSAAWRSRRRSRRCATS